MEGNKIGHRMWCHTENVDANGRMFSIGGTADFFKRRLHRTATRSVWRRASVRVYGLRALVFLSIFHGNYCDKFTNYFGHKSSKQLSTARLLISTQIFVYDSEM